jgi:hypothetical protein
MVMGWRAVLRAALTGLGLGAAWGVAARVWMRLVTDAPEFSWTGTLFIIGLSAWFGLFVGMAAAARRDGGSRWWLLAAVPGLLLFASQGALFFPGSLVAAVALSRRSHRGVWLAVAVVAVSVMPVLLWNTFKLNEETMLPASTLAQVSTLVGMPLLGLALAWMARDLFRGARRDRLAVRQSVSPDLALSNLRSDSSLEVPAGPA